MNRFEVPVRTGYAMSWSPPSAAPRPGAAPLRMRGPALGQRASALDTFMGNPVLALLTDVIVAGSAAYLAWGIGVATKERAKQAREKGVALVAENPWSVFWWAVAAAATIKAFHDGSRASMARR